MAKRVAQDQDVPVPAPQRNYAVRGIAALLAPIVRPAFRKRSPAAANLLADWANLAGPNLAARAKPMKFSGGTLTLACTGPAAMELQHAAPAIIGRLNLALGGAMVERLRFVAQAPAAALVAPAMTTRIDVCVPDNLPPGELGAALARLYKGIRSRRTP